MDKISVENIVKSTGGKLIKGSKDAFVTGVKHDSRLCGAGDMFVAVKGENRDGHMYIRQVLDAGCSTVMVSHTDGWYEEVKDRDCNIIMTDDTIRAMGRLAAYYLDTLDVVRIAVTGSVGKTSTRDMIYYALSERYSCGRNMKNYNNAIGLPLSVFTFDSSMDAVVLEMGMEKKGEIDRLAGIVKPDIAVITNIGVSHIENLGSREGIFRAKMEAGRHITSRGARRGTLIFPYDGEFLTRENTAGDYCQVMIGEDGRSDYIISDVDDMGLDGIKFTVECDGVSHRISIPVPGTHNAVNASLAIAVGRSMGLSYEEIERGLSRVVLTGSRLKYLRDGRIRVIDDTYNASPESMKSAMKVLEKSACDGKRVAVLGDIFELGDRSARQHYEVGLFARGLRIDRLAAVGRNARHIAEGAEGGDVQVLYYSSKDELLDDIDSVAGHGDLVLVKGSRGMKMEEIVEKLVAK